MKKRSKLVFSLVLIIIAILISIFSHNLLNADVKELTGFASGLLFGIGIALFLQLLFRDTKKK